MAQTIVTSVCVLQMPRPDMRKKTILKAPDKTVAYRSALRPATAWPLISHVEFPAVPAATGGARNLALYSSAVLISDRVMS
jgi:hypothetical protein